MIPHDHIVMAAFEFVHEHGNDSLEIRKESFIAGAEWLALQLCDKPIEEVVFCLFNLRAEIVSLQKNNSDA